MGSVKAAENVIVFFLMMIAFGFLFLSPDAATAEKILGIFFLLFVAALVLLFVVVLLFGKRYL